MFYSSSTMTQWRLIWSKVMAAVQHIQASGGNGFLKGRCGQAHLSHTVVADGTTGHARPIGYMQMVDASLQRIVWLTRLPTDQ
jgi:hypothetical protein